MGFLNADKFKRFAVQPGQEVGGQNRRVTAREGVIEFVGSAQLAQFNLVPEGRQVVKDNGELVDLQSIGDIDDNPGVVCISRKPHGDRAIMGPPGNRVRIHEG